MNRRTVRAALLAFLLSRAAFFALVVVGSNVAFLRKVYNDRIWETTVVLQRERIVPGIIVTVMNGDAWWYRSIARNGYDRRPFAPGVSNWAFFPLYPLTVRTLAVSGDYAIDGMLVSHAALLGALLAAQRDRWWLAGLAGALAAATRPGGGLLLPALALLAIERGVLRRAFAWLLLIPLGAGAFMLHLYRLTGNAFAFAGVQESWGRHATLFWTPLVTFLRRPSAIGEPWNLIGMNFLAAVLIAAAACWWLARRQWSLGAYTL